MRTIFFLVLFLGSSFIAQSAKTYELTVTVSSLYNGTKLAGIKVVGVFEKDQVIEQVTDANGTVVFKELKAKSISFTVTDETGTYRESSKYFIHSKQENETQVIRMRYTTQREQALVDSKRKQIDDDTSVAMVQTTSSINKMNDCDSSSSTLASFPGGMSELMKFVVYNLEYPQSAIEEGLMGKVYTRFIIEKDGSISNIEVIRGVCKEIDEEAIRIIAYMPNWIPGTCNGEPTRSTMMLPLSFYLE